MQTLIKTAEWLKSAVLTLMVILIPILAFGINAFSFSNVEHLLCINKSTGSFICLFIYFHCHRKTHFLLHTSRHQTTKQFESQGKGMIGGFNVNFSLSQQNMNQCRRESLLMQMKMCLVMPGWAESSRAPSHGGFVVFGVCLSVCQRVGGFMGPPSVLLSQVRHLQHAREMNWGRRGEHLFLQDVQDLQWSHEVAEERGSGRCAGLDHLYLCLSHVYCHWHPSRGWVLTCTIAHY